MVKITVYLLSVTHFISASYLLWLSITYIREVHIDYAVIVAADKALNGSREIALTYARGHMHVSVYRLLLAIFHGALAIVFCMVLINGSATVAGIFIRSLLITLLGNQVAILYTERDTRIAMFNALIEHDKQSRSHHHED